MTKAFESKEQGQLITISSLEKSQQNNPIGPDWSFNFWHFQNHNPEYNAELTDFLLKESAIILTKYPPWKDDGGTGLGPNTTTARYPYFNLLKYDNELIRELKNQLANEIKKFLDQSKIILQDDLYINCWYNVLYPGQHISAHFHSPSREGFISCHYTVSCEESLTYYELPFQNGSLSMTNFIGEGMFFPSYLVHGTSPHNGKNPRITIAMDVGVGKKSVADFLLDNVITLSKDTMEFV